MRTIHNYSPGDLFANGRYRLLKMVGVGGFAEVWLAKDLLVEKDIAIKIYAHLDDEGLKQLRDEYANLQPYSHPNILKAEHLDICDRRPYLIMKYCEGGNLNTHIGNLSSTDLLHVVRDIMSALTYLHENGVVHQDIKPANILIDTSGAQARFVLCDFGISARTRHSMSRSMKTKDKGSVYLTTFYAPPEKFSSNRQDRQPYAEGDLFSFGITLLEMTGVLQGLEDSLGAEMMNRNKQLDHYLHSFQSSTLQLMAERMLSFSRIKRGSAKLYYDWAINALENLSVSESKNVRRVDVFTLQQERRLDWVAEQLQADDSKREDDVSESEAEIDVLELVDIDDAEEEIDILDLEPATESTEHMDSEILDNESRQVSELKVHKVPVGQTEINDSSLESYRYQTDDFASETSKNSTPPVQIGPTEPPKKKGLWFVLLLSVLLAVAVTFGIIYIVDQERGTSYEDDKTEIYIPSSELSEVIQGVARIEGRINTFSSTTFYNRSDFNTQRTNLISEIKKEISDIDEYVKTSSLSQQDAVSVSEQREKLMRLQDLINSYTFARGFTPTGGQ